jgi:hypothetical protein
MVAPGIFSVYAGKARTRSIAHEPASGTLIWSDPLGYGSWDFSDISLPDCAAP